MLEKEQILQSRARHLARPENKEEDKREFLEVVAFCLADELYGLESQFIQEVFPIEAIVPLPCAPPFVSGLINVRRKVFSVIDLKVLFSLPRAEKNLRQMAIILDNGKMQYAILADRISGICTTPLNGLVKSLPTLTGLRSGFLKGITKDQMIILDAEKILECEALLVNEKI